MQCRARLQEGKNGLYCFHIALLSAKKGKKNYFFQGETILFILLYLLCN
jgi:hypothetical protein